MNMKEIMQWHPEYAFIKESNLSARMLKATDGDATIVFDNSTWQFVIISIKNYIKAGVLEAFVVPKNNVDDGMIYFLKSRDGDLIRNKHITKYWETQNLYKEAKRKQKSEVKDHIKRIRMYMGEQL